MSVLRISPPAKNKLFSMAYFVFCDLMVSVSSDRKPAHDTRLFYVFPAGRVPRVPSAEFQCRIQLKKNPHTSPVRPQYLSCISRG